MNDADAGTIRYKTLPEWAKFIVISFSIIGVCLAVYSVFSLHIGDIILQQAMYYFLIIACFMPVFYLITPLRKADKGLPWYDIIGAVLSFGLAIYFSLNHYNITIIGWRSPSFPNLITGFILWLLIAEGGRRIGGNIYLAVVLVLGLYPLFTAYMPGRLEGYANDFTATIGSSIFTDSGILGLPMHVIGNILIGFLVFGGTLIASGAGKFFLNIAYSLMGTVRGGAAKVSILGSMFFGSLSGSAFSNVISTGSITIPAMKRMGYPSDYAGAIEAIASSGGILMPPVMGAIAFIMCEIIGVGYHKIIIAAAIPAILFYFAVFMQVDAYAAKTGLKGLPKAEVPSLKKTLAEGWHFIAVIVFLLWGLMYMKWDAKAPFYASGLLFMLSFVHKENRLTPKRILEALQSIGALIAQTLAILLPVGFIICGLTITGVAASLTVWVVNLGGGNVLLILLLGALMSYIMGMAGLAMSGYVFLAVTMAPALIQAGGLNVLATHLFIVYYDTLAGITLPVAAAAFLGAAIAGASPMKTAVTAMRLAAVIYFVPFFFVFNPALLFQGPIWDTLHILPFCLIGIILVAAGSEGYLLKVGILKVWARPFLIVAGFLLAFPEWVTNIVGASVAFIVITVSLLTKRRNKQLQETMNYPAAEPRGIKMNFYLI